MAVFHRENLNICYCSVPELWIQSWSINFSFDEVCVDGWAEILGSINSVMNLILEE
jgi:hypothetical protein